MFILRNEVTKYFMGMGTGLVVTPPPDTEVMYMELTLATYEGLIVALPGWGGDPRFVIIGDNGLPESYTLRELTPEEAEQDLQTYLQEVRELAEVAVTNIPGWATWTMSESVNYIQTNVTDLASAKTVLIAMAQMLVTMRNSLWPHLENSQ